MNETVSQKITQLNTDRVTGITNLTQKGVTAYDTDGFSQIVSKILEIPSDKLTSVRVNNEISYRKQVPSNSAGFCYLNSIGGMTYKSKTYDADTNSGYFNFNVTFDKPITLPSPTVSGATGWIFQPVICGVLSKIPYANYIAVDGVSYSSYDGIPSGTVISNLNGDSGVPEGLASDVQLKIIPRFESVKDNEGTGEYWFPPECFTDLRDAKPTAVKSYGANLIPFPYYFSRAGFGEMDVGFTKEWAGLTFTINADRSISVKGTATGTPSFVIGEYLDFPNEDMYLSANMIGTYDGRAYVYTTDETGAYYTTDVISAGWVKLPKGHEFSWVGIQIFSGTTIDATFYPMLNTGSSPLPYSPYFEKTYTLPEAITNTLGKGYDATLFNEYSFVDKKAVKRVGSTTVNGDMITGFDEGGAVALKSRYQFVVPISDMKILNGYTQYGKILTPFFPNIGSVNSANSNQTVLYQVAYTTLSDNPNLFYYLPLGFFGDTTADYSKGKAWFNSAQLPIIYEKETYTETPITTDFNPLIEVEAGGYLEFVNEYGYAVPSTVTFSTINGGGTT